jgi:hypothetical protein
MLAFVFSSISCFLSHIPTSTISSIVVSSSYVFISIIVSYIKLLFTFTLKIVSLVEIITL